MDGKNHIFSVLRLMRPAYGAAYAIRYGVLKTLFFTLLSLTILSVTALSVVTNASALNNLPTPVDEALRQAEAKSDIRVSFTIRFRWQFQGGQTIEIVDRYNAEQKSWTRLQGNANDLPPRGRERYRQYKRLESKPGGLLYADYRDYLSDVTLANENEKNLIYSFSSPMAPDDLQERESLIDTKMTIDRDEGWIREYSIKSIKPFKPNALSSLDDFAFVQTFSKPSQNIPAMMTEFYYRLKGKRAFKKFDEEFSIKFSDFEIVS